MAGNDDLVVLRPEGLYCAAGDFHIDPWRPVPRAVITHGHGDHARPGMGEYHCSTGSVPILRWRLGDVRLHAHAEGVPFALGRVQVSLHAAGHVLGSSQVRIDDGEQVWVASGDYKRQPDPTCTPFEVVPCDTFITEATFALPIYRWPDTRAVAAEIAAWRRECAQRGEAAVLLCYALGKAQRVLAELRAVDDQPAWLHGAIANGVAVYRQAGIPMLDSLTVAEQGRQPDAA
uniref:DNA ligase-associated DEXH box helicase n=1 Tax=Stenotrophomonas indicatrix TaxID=2045451 RepID=UPI0028967057